MRAHWIPVGDFRGRIRSQKILNAIQNFRFLPHSRINPGEQLTTVKEIPVARLSQLLEI